MYFESAKGIEITPTRAKKEIEAHGCSWHEFLIDNGMQETYLTQDVMLWLFYYDWDINAKIYNEKHGNVLRYL